MASCIDWSTKPERTAFTTRMNKQNSAIVGDVTDDMVQHVCSDEELESLGRKVRKVKTLLVKMLQRTLTFVCTL